MLAVCVSLPSCLSECPIGLGRLPPLKLGVASWFALDSGKGHITFDWRPESRVLGTFPRPCSWWQRTGTRSEREGSLGVSQVAAR